MAACILDTLKIKPTAAQMSWGQAKQMERVKVSWHPLLSDVFHRRLQSTSLVKYKGTLVPAPLSFIEGIEGVNTRVGWCLEKCPL